MAGIRGGVERVEVQASLQDNIGVDMNEEEQYMMACSY